GLKIVAFLVVIAIVMAAGMLGFDVIMKVQTWITYATVVLTVGYVVLTWDHISWSAVSAVPSGPLQGVLGALILGITAFGLGWVNSAADYSRYLPRSASGAGVVGWTTFGASVAPILLVLFGVPLAASDADLSAKIGSDPIGALTTILPTWYLIPFAIVAILGLVGGAVLDIYSSGLTLLTLGLKIPRWSAAGLDGVICILGTVYVVWIAENFLWTFMAFLIVVGVPVAAWCGVFLADLALRHQAYDETALYDPRGRYGSVNWVSIALVLVGTFLGWGLVTNATEGFGWLGYLLDPIGLGGREGGWAYANLGVLVAIVVGFAGYYLLCAGRVRRQESAA
ncbi:MAG: allantoin permease, partial [Candidatus Lutibacillus vidarii]